MRREEDHLISPRAKKQNHFAKQTDKTAQVERVGGDAELHAAILDSCESFVGKWNHLDPAMDRTPPALVPGAQTVDGRNAVTSPPETHQLVGESKRRRQSRVV